MGIKKDFRGIVAELEDQGWEISQISGTHYRATPPDKEKPLVHFSVSADPRAIKNTVADLRRSGFVWPPERSRDGAPDSQPDSSSELEGLFEVENDPFADEVEPTPTPEPTLTHEERMEQLWSELKDAKGYRDMTAEHVRACEEQFEAARRALEEAKVEHERASETLRGKKKAFDETFGEAA
jgi:hypothetical protein